jgi:ATP-dependent protease ClpP protease subunit
MLLADTSLSFASDLMYKVRDQSRVVKVIGRVDGEIISAAAKLEKMTRTNTSPIYMLINSPGGSVQAGMAFVDAMRMAKRRGVQFYCATQVMAASMAFIFINECQHRYATANARFLFHPISLSTNGSRLQELVVDLHHTEKEEQKIMHNLKTNMGLDWRTFHRNYFAETFWQAEILAETTAKSKWLTIVNRIEGFGDDLFNYKKPQNVLSFLIPNNNNKQGSDAVSRILERYENGR